MATHQSTQGSGWHRGHHTLTWRMSRDQATMCYQISRVLSPVTYKMFPFEASSSVCKLKLLQSSRSSSSSGGNGAEDTWPGRSVWWWCKKWVKPERETAGQEGTEQRRHQKWGGSKRKQKPGAEGLLTAEEERGEEERRKCKQSLGIWKVMRTRQLCPGCCWITKAKLLLI